MDYEERQAEWLKNSGVKEGDRVLVIGGQPEWNDGQTDTIGMVGKVECIVMDESDRGVLVRFGSRCPCGDSDCGSGWYYPFYLLTKVEND